MTNSKDRQQIPNSSRKFSGAENVFLEEIEAITGSPAAHAALSNDEADELAADIASAEQAARAAFTANPALMAAAEKNRLVDWPHAKKHGYTARQNRERDAYRKTPPGRAERNDAARDAYHAEAARQGRVARRNADLSQMTPEQKAQHLRDRKALNKKNSRKAKVALMDEAEQQDHRAAQSAARQARRDATKKI